MILKHFLSSKPKWQHSDPEVRRQAVQSIPATDQDTLAQIARDDADPAVRRQACRRLTRLDLLRELSTRDPDAGVRELTAAHFRHLLCSRDPGSPPVEACIAQLAQIEDQRLLEHVATNAPQAELRLAAIGRLDGSATLLECAMHDATAANRLEAAQHLEDKGGLEELARRIGKKDKNVYRVVRQKLREIAEREAAPARIRSQGLELCEKVERLGRLQSWAQDQAVLDHLDKQWAVIAEEADPELRHRYETARQGFLDALETYRRENQSQVEAEEAKEQGLRARRALLEEFSEAAERDTEADLRTVRDRVETAWRALPPLPEEDDRRLARELASAQEAVSTRLGRLEEARLDSERLQRLLGNFDGLLRGSAPLDHRTLTPLLKQAASQAPTAGDPVVHVRLEDARQLLEHRLEKQRHHAEQKLEQIPERLDELDEHLEAGELRKSEPLYQSVQAALHLLELSGINRRKFAALEQRLRAAAPRIRTLQNWRKWGTDQHRQALCETLEGLLGAEMEIEQAARTLHDAQVEWKRLDHSGSPVNHPLWERFHALAEQVYERCRPYLEQQAEEREQHRVHREALCAELEQFLNQVDWERMDWRKAIRAEREMRSAWAAAGPVDGKQRRGLERRFRAAIDRLDQHLAAERQRNRDHKRNHIAQVEALVEDTDLPHAIDETKRLQREWHTTVPARQGEENRLWKRFRQACDAVFARRQIVHEERTRSEDENLRARRAICEDLQRLATAGLDAGQMEWGLTELQERWEAMAHLPVPRRALPALENAWRDAQSTWSRAVRQTREQRERKEFDLLRQRAALCAELEAVARGEGNSPDEAQRIRAAWSELPTLKDGALQQAIEGRFGQAIAAATGESGAPIAGRTSQADNDRKREELCLQLEILAGIDSPQELAGDRLAFQVNRLTEHMRDGAKDPLEGATRLVRDWYVLGPASGEVAGALEQRFERARSALLCADKPPQGTTSP